MPAGTSAPGAKTTVTLYARTGPIKGRSFDVGMTKSTVGRDHSCTLRIDDPKISRVHMYIELRGGSIFFQDNKSTNGTFLNGKRVPEGFVEAGDVLQIGSTEFAIQDAGEFRSIQFIATDSMVTSVLSTGAVKADALAEKFAQVFEYYKSHHVEESDAERIDIVRMQRMLNSLKTLFAIGQTMTKLVSVPELLKMVADKLFEVFAAAENVVILMRDEASGETKPVHAATRDSPETPLVMVSQTVLERAMRERATLVANDARRDMRLSASDSIIGLEVKSVMCAPLVVNDRVLGALYLDNRTRSVNYDDMDAELVTAFANQAAVALDNARLCDELQGSYHQTLQTLVLAIEAKDAYTMGHTQRVAMLSVAVARELGLPPARIDRIKLAADLHDIGKIGIKEGIINKAGALTDFEYENMKSHVILGEKILKPISYLRDILPYVRHHHEKWDGSGYPDNLKGEECPLEARIIALADAFDAMTSQRSYNKPLTITQAVDRVKQASGRHFDPTIVDAFVRMMVRESSTVESVVASAYQPKLDPPTSEVPAPQGEPVG